MSKLKNKISSQSQEVKVTNGIEGIPLEFKKWVESVPLKRRHYVLSMLGYLMYAASIETPTGFLERYTTEGLIAKILREQVPQKLVKNYLIKFSIDKDLSELVLKNYIQQFYIHSAQDLRTQPDLSLDSVLRLVHNTEERNNFFNYILGFEILKMMFQMSWLQHERLYQLQKNQENFIKAYIKPIQYAHRVNGIIVPKYEKIFFAKRNFFIQKPKIKEKKLVELVMVTFTTDIVTNLGFLILHHLNFLAFDYEYIFNSDPEDIFIL